MYIEIGYTYLSKCLLNFRHVYKSVMGLVGFFLIILVARYSLSPPLGATVDETQRQGRVVE